MSIGDKIKKFVEERVPDKKDYKVYLGMSYGGMHKYFTDQRKPGFDVLKRLRRLGMDINGLMNSDSDVIQEKDELLVNENPQKYSSKKSKKGD